jgi:hypothetical protein
MINNTDLIRPMLSFDKDDFYFVQVLKRRKDNPDMEKDMSVIDNFYISSFESYDRIVPQIIKLCDHENARGYFRLNKRNYKALAPHMVKRTLEIAFGNDCHALKNVFDSVAGEHHSDPDKKWIVDIDWVDFDISRTLVIPKENGDLGVMTGDSRMAELLSLIQGLQLEAKRDPLMRILETKNGLHVITRPFNLQIFKTKFPKVDVHRDNPTILYTP